MAKIPEEVTKFRNELLPLVRKYGDVMAKYARAKDIETAREADRAFGEVVRHVDTFFKIP